MLQSENQLYGSYTGPMLGIFMKEVVRRAMVLIKRYRFDFEAEAKLGKSGAMDDVVTNADREVQAMAIKLIQESCPGFGIIAEEAEMRIASTLPGAPTFTIDPLDGTKAFKRMQSHGVGTMISLIFGGRIVAAYVGDPLTGEVYGYRPGSDTVHRIQASGLSTQLQIDTSTPLAQRYAMLRDPFDEHSLPMQRLLKPGVNFKSHEITSGSIGISMARLWKNEIAAAVLRPSLETPWDRCPVAGISEKLGFVFVDFSVGGALLVINSEPGDPTRHQQRLQDVLVIHRNYLSQFNVPVFA